MLFFDFDVDSSDEIAVFLTITWLTWTIIFPL